MIVRPKPSLLDLFTVFRLSILSRVAPQIALLTLVSVVVSVWAEKEPGLFRQLNATPLTLLGIAVSIFLSFRNGVCYDRWWEARRQVGALVAEMRSLARLLVTVEGGDRVRREAAVLLLARYTHTLMDALRGRATGNAPDGLLREHARLVAAMLRDGEFGEILFQRFDERLSVIASIQASCERLRSTPTPFTYSLLLHRTVYVFCFLLPFGLAGSLGYATPVLCAVLAYAFFGLDAIGDELEQPFGDTMNALPLDALARAIEISLLETLGRTDVPAPLAAVDSVLM